MKNLVKGAWVVVADEDKALVFINAGDAVAPVLALEKRIDAKELLAVADRSARLRDHKQHETVEPPDYHRMAGATLADAVAAYLRQMQRDKKLAVLVLIAPPQVLGALRETLADDLAEETVAEIAKTLTGHPVARITEILLDDLAAG